MVSDIEKVLSIVPATPGFISVFQNKGEEPIELPVALWVLYRDQDGSEAVTAISVGDGTDYLEFDVNMASHIGYKLKQGAF